MTIEGPQIWSMISALIALFAVLLSVYTLLTARSRSEYDNLVKASSNHEQRLSAVEQTVKHAPEPGDFSALRVSIEALKGQLAVITERVEPIRAIADRMQDWMLERGK